MSDGDVRSIWEKIDKSVLARPGKPDEGTPSIADEDAGSPRWRRIRWLAADAVGFGLWLYVFAKVFIADFDRWVLDRVAPQWMWLVDFRAFVFMTLAALVLLLFRRKNAWWMVYVVVWPLVVLFWKIPRFYYKRRDWLLLLGSMHIVWTFFRSLRFGFAGFTVVILSILGILLSDSPYLLGAAAIALVLTWFASLYKAFRYSVVPSRFVRSQRSLLDRILRSDQFWSLVALEEAVKRPEIEQLNRDQATNAITKATTGLIAYRAGHLWAYQLDRYRRSGVSILFSAVSVAALVLQALVTFAFVNMAIYTLDPSQFNFTEVPGVATFVYYSFASIFMSEVSMLVPAGPWAASVQVVAGFSSGVLLLLLVVTLVFSVRQSRTDKEATRAIRQMRRRSNEFADRLAAEYELSLDELLRRLDELGSGLIGVVSYLSAQLPDAVDEEDDEDDDDVVVGVS